MFGSAPPAVSRADLAAVGDGLELVARGLVQGRVRGWRHGHAHRVEQLLGPQRRVGHGALDRAEVLHERSEGVAGLVDPPLERPHHVVDCLEPVAQGAHALVDGRAVVVGRGGPPGGAGFVPVGGQRRGDVQDRVGRPPDPCRRGEQASLDPGATGDQGRDLVGGGSGGRLREGSRRIGEVLRPGGGLAQCPGQLLGPGRDVVRAVGQPAHARGQRVGGVGSGLGPLGQATYARGQ